MRTFNIEKTETQCVVTWRIFSFFISMCMCPIFIAATLMVLVCTNIMVDLIFVQREYVVILSALIILAFWLFIFAMTVHLLFGETMFVLNADGLRTKYTCLIFQLEKLFALADICRFEHGIRRNQKGIYSLRVVCLESKSCKNYSLPPHAVLEAEADDLCDQLNAFLETLKENESRERSAAE